MTSRGFRKAVKYESRLRLALCGPSGSGKTFTSLLVAQRLAAALAARVAVVDTERGSASKYADLFEFDVLELESFHPKEYVAAIELAQREGYGVLVIDSLSHAWAGKDGALELVDRACMRNPNGNSFAAWREVTPLHNKLVDAITGSDLHLIATMRSKMDYVQERDERGRAVIRKVGMAPVQRDGLEYEFDVVGDLDAENTLVVSKTRCPALAGVVVPKPTGAMADTLLGWLKGEPPPEPGASAQSLKELNHLRERLRLSKEELGQEVSLRFGASDPRQLTESQVAQLRAWLLENAPPALSRSAP